MEQPQYNMLHRHKVEVEFAQIYKTVGLGTTIWSPLASGILTGKYNTNNPPEATRMNIEGLEWLKDKTLTEQNLAKVEQLQSLSRDIDITMP